MVYFDRYGDGDDFNDEGYKERFGIILQALREKRKLEITYQSQGKKASVWNCIPRSLEYSSKDDKFRLYVVKKLVDSPRDGGFSAYGLSDTATVPEFLTDNSF